MDYPETPHERRVTWSLMGLVVGFVLLMTCVVVWITSSILREELGGPGQEGAAGVSTESVAVTATSPAAVKRPAKATPAPTGILEATGAAAEEPDPALGDTTGQQESGPAQATWTPARNAPYVKFLYWYVRPNRVKLGGCVKITWETQYSIRLKLYRDGEILMEDLPASTTIEDCPAHTGYTVYRLVGWNAAEESSWVQLQVKVDKAQ